jgi:hypothetical protein
MLPRIVTIVLLLPLLLLAASCGSSGSAEDQVRELIAEGERAAEERDLGALMELVARDYRDAEGNGREELRNYLRGYLLVHPTVRVSSRVEGIDFPYEDMARVRLQLATMGQGAGGSPLRGIAADLHEVELEIVLEDGRWRVLRAEHRPLLGN